MKGFDYRTQQEFDRTAAVLKDDLATIIAAGGFRRHEDGETFAHSKKGAIIWEAYGYVGSPARSAINRQRNTASTQEQIHVIEETKISGFPER